MLIDLQRRADADTMRESRPHDVDQTLSTVFDDYEPTGHRALPGDWIPLCHATLLNKRDQVRAGGPSIVRHRGRVWD